MDDLPARSLVEASVRRIPRKGSKRLRERRHGKPDRLAIPTGISPLPFSPQPKPVVLARYITQSAPGARNVSGASPCPLPPLVGVLVAPQHQADRHAFKLKYLTQSKTRPPTFFLSCSRPDVLPDAYKRYLVNGLREDFDLAGVPIRLMLRRDDNPYEGRKRRNP